MQRRIGLLWVVGFFGLVAAADAQTPPPATAGTAFDGTYAFVSATKVNETYTTMRTEHLQQCPERGAARPLVVVNGQARLLHYEGTVGPQGELLMRNVPGPVKSGILPGAEVTISGKIDGYGTARARQTGYNCRYDLLWQKQSK
jgi:hypothetical protein